MSIKQNNVKKKRKPLTSEQKAAKKIYEKKYYQKNKDYLLPKSKEYYWQRKLEILQRNNI